MHFFPSAHASGPDWQDIVVQVVAQLRAQITMQPDIAPSIGLLYISATLVPHARAILERLRADLPGVRRWSGGGGGQVMGGDMHYGQRPALAVLLLHLPADGGYVFSGLAPLSQAPSTEQLDLALVHGDRQLPDHDALFEELAGRMRSGLLAGGMGQVQFAVHSIEPSHGPAAVGSSGTLVGGVSGVVFGREAGLRCKPLQHCKPLGEVHAVTRAQDNVIVELDGKPAMDVLLHTLDLRRSLDPHAFVAMVQDTWLALSESAAPLAGAHLPGTQFVTRLLGLDPARRALVLPHSAAPWPHVRFCRHDAGTAQSEMRRVCAEILEDLAPDMHQPASAGPWSPAQASAGSSMGSATRTVVGALYLRSAPRQPLPGGVAVDADLQQLRHALGPVPLIGWEAEGAIIGNHVQHTGAQLLVFTRPLQVLSGAPGA